MGRPLLVRVFAVPAPAVVSWAGLLPGVFAGAGEVPEPALRVLFLKRVPTPLTFLARLRFVPVGGLI
jgi:hypothetical protein